MGVRNLKSPYQFGGPLAWNWFLPPQIRWHAFDERRYGVDFRPEVILRWLMEQAASACQSAEYLQTRKAVVHRISFAAYKVYNFRDEETTMDTSVQVHQRAMQLVA